MNETRAIIEAFIESRTKNERCALATVVNVEGSAYRRPGARMLMTENGRIVGSLSGGCLERDVFERARIVMQTREPIVVRYDTGADTEIVWGLGLGCNGIVQILIEPLDIAAMPLHLEFLSDCITRQKTGVIATVFGGKSDIKPGSRLMLQDDDEAIIEFENGEFARAAMRDARRALSDKKSSDKIYELTTGAAEVFIEFVEPPVPLVIFGANADAAPVAEYAQKLGWHVTVVDTQARSASLERFADCADAVTLCRPETAADCVPLTQRTAAIVMTHNYQHDLELFKTLLPSSVQYVGMMGPKRRTERIIAEALAEGLTISDEQMNRLHAPIGLDIGAETPSGIALSIVGEIRAVLSEREGGFLKRRNAPIHVGGESRILPTNGGIEHRAETLEAIGA